MPSHYRSPYGYSYFNPTGKEQAALTIGSLLAGALAASSGRSKGDAIRKGIAGTMAGYGSGYQNYQNLMGDAFGRDLQAKSYGQRVKEHELSGEKFAEEKRQYEETEKPERLSKTAWYNERETKTPEWLQKIEYRESSPENAAAYERAFPGKVSAKEPDYLSKMEKIDTKIADLELKDPSQSNPRIQASINSLRNIKAQYHNKLYGGGTSVKDLGFDFNAPPQQASAKTPQAVGLDQFLNEARKVNPGVSDDELTQFWINKYKK